MNDMKKYLVCHTDLIMFPGGRFECKVGDISEITSESGREINKKTNDGGSHTFDKSDWHPNYYGNWFHIKTESEIREDKFKELL